MSVKQNGYFGVMLDMSRNGVMRVSEVKRYVDYISAFGYNSLQVYTEDTYEMEGEPFFGRKTLPGLCEQSQGQGYSFRT